MHFYYSYKHHIIYGLQHQKLHGLFSTSISTQCLHLKRQKHFEKRCKFLNDRTQQQLQSMIIESLFGNMIWSLSQLRLRSNSASANLKFSNSKVNPIIQETDSLRSRNRIMFIIYNFCTLASPENIRQPICKLLYLLLLILQLQHIFLFLSISCFEQLYFQFFKEGECTSLSY